MENGRKFRMFIGGKRNSQHSNQFENCFKITFLFLYMWNVCVCSSSLRKFKIVGIPMNWNVKKWCHIIHIECNAFLRKSQPDFDRFLLLCRHAGVKNIEQSQTNSVWLHFNDYWANEWQQKFDSIVCKRYFALQIENTCTHARALAHIRNGR